MGKALYIGSNIGSASGYTRRYFSEFPDARGILFRVEILDNVSGTAGFNFSTADGPTEFDLGRDGVTISWDGQDDNLHESVIGSFSDDGLSPRRDASLDFHGRTGRIRGGPVPGCPVSFRRESRLYDRRSGRSVPPEWFGTLVLEGIEYVSNEANEFLRLTATDGLASLE